MKQAWIGVDLDGTLAYYGGGIAAIGPPIGPMVERVKRWLAEGEFEVRIFTARVAVVPGLRSGEGAADEAFAANQREMIEAWCEEHLGQKLAVTATKDYLMVALYDDRCQPVETNTGRLLLNPEGIP